MLRSAGGRYRGRIAKTMGDGFLIEFPRVVDAVRSSLEIQHALGGRKLRGSVCCNPSARGNRP
jgi:class 3 adenylate cyclase